MSLRDIAFTAWSSLGANKLRVMLTLLGIIIGVAAVISLMAVGRGAQEVVTSRIEALGTNLLFVREANTGDSDASPLTLDDAYALVDPVFAPSVKGVAPTVSASGIVTALGESTSAGILGITSEYDEVRNVQVATGEFVSPAHVTSRSEVVVLGATVAETLFGQRNPVGSAVRINRREFTVIGVLAARGGGFGSPDTQILIPLTTAYYRLSGDRTAQGGISVDTINVQVADVSRTESATREISTLLRLRHRNTSEDDFAITNQQDTIETLEETSATFTVFLGAIASISLLVGGIGIMNIMLVSVTERTREIGIRKALGAKRRDLLLQFVAEATLLSLAGGVIGVLAGFLAGLALDGRNLAGQQFNTAFNSDIAILAMVVSAAIGLFFGIYPAMRAARLHPIEALRHE
jgi:putative ABC transport system permease protein